MASKGDIKAGSAYVSLTVKDGLTAGLRKASQQLKDFGANVSTVGKTLASVGVGAFGGVASGVVMLKSAVDAASDLSETTAKVGEIFGSDALPELEKFAAGAATSLGQSKQSALDAIATFGVFGKAAGLTGDQLSGFATELTTLASDLASFGNTSPEEAITAIGAALRGESEPIRAYGVLLDDATLRQEALSMGIVSTTKQALTPQQRVLAAHQAILKQTSDAQGDFARTAGGLANQQRILAAVFENTKAVVGGALLPTFTKIVAEGTKVFQIVSDIASQNQELIASVAKVTAIVGGAALAVAGLGFTFIGIGGAITGVGAVLGGLATALGFVLSPVGLITTALVSGAAAWLKYTDSGKSAMATLKGAFTEILDVGRRTFQGIADAVMAGDLAGAGNIAISGLHLALLKGLDSIIGDTSGAVGSIIKQFAGGDFEGAWDTTVASLRATWAEFTEGMVAMFTVAADSVVGIWEKSVKSISAKILEITSMMPESVQVKVLGVNLSEEQRRRDRMNAEARRRGLAESNPSVVDEAKSIAAAQITGQADSARAKLDEINRNAQRNTRDAKGEAQERISTGNAMFDAKIAELDQQISTLTKKAAADREEAEERRKKAVETVTSPEAEGSVAGTFSAAAAVAMGQGGGPMDKVVKAIEEQDKNEDKRTDKLVQAIKATTLEFA